MRTPSISRTVVNNLLRVKTSITPGNYQLPRDLGRDFHSKGHEGSSWDKLGFSGLSACTPPGACMREPQPTRAGGPSGRTDRSRSSAQPGAAASTDCSQPASGNYRLPGRRALRDTLVKDERKEWLQRFPEPRCSPPESSTEHVTLHSGSKSVIGRKMYQEHMQCRLKSTTDVR